MEMVYLETIGKCEHCGTVICVQGLPSGAIDAVWKCSNLKCKKELTHISFGYTEVEKGKFNRTRWVSKKGEWTSEKPTEDFKLGSWEVIVEQRHHFYF